ncbi:homoserine O-acetyltransferase family protein [Deinococcus maricopensis]|uniref:Homoserine O-acetyltransferase n=1 Tax=Deinococcus maricopensis (strain DSM 21211 / LMG 22137 / NRRL B-23946 / LB-34) TaxID=709986 RepID=E8U8Z8_DEIML|nr:alpha/beta fold hydrolase family protein [Deinococcus maricopensis]ADV67537.1 homoserine O-acetyltransferase [Deinococcus maricopensis DSM 21211]
MTAHTAPARPHVPTPQPDAAPRLRTATLFRDRPLLLDNGHIVSNVRLAYHTYGTPRDHAILVLHALTGTSAVHEWWGALFGPGKALDPERHFIVCSNVLGGCAGSSGPAELGTDDLSIPDMVRAARELLAHLGVRRVTVIGGSMGGMHAIEWLRAYPDLIDRAVVIAAPAQHSPWAIGLNSAARAAIRAAPGGEGLKVARQIAMLSYRSPDSYAATQAGPSPRARGEHAITTYLQHHGQKLHERFCERTYLTLTRAMDAYRTTPADLACVHVPTLVVGIRSDVLYPPHEVRAVADALGNARYWELDSIHGHDAFLMDADTLNDRIHETLHPQE